MPNADAKPPFWSQGIEALLADLHSQPDGLSSSQAAAQLKKVGPNRLDVLLEPSPLGLLLRQFKNPLVLILVIGAGVALVLREWIDAAIILAIVLGSSLLGFVQEYRASVVVQKLKNRLALTARVLRDGSERTVPASAIVPGDVVLLRAGNLIPADGLIMDAQDFLVSEASITGESFPVEKRPGVLPADTPIARKTNAVFLGSSVRSGTARMLAVKTGIRTEYGVIAKQVARRPPETDFSRGVRRFGYMLIRVMIVIVLFVLVANILLDRPVFLSLMFAVALAVGLSPELLPAIVSVTLSAGAHALSKRGVIVRRLEAIENLGSMNVFCTDKTGTLTEGTIVLRESLDPAGRPSDEVHLLAFLNATFETGIANPLDAALVRAGAIAGFGTGSQSKVDEIPYDFERRRLTVVLSDGEAASQHVIVTKGAFAEVLSVCSYVQADGEVTLDEAERERLRNLFRRKSEEGYRVLAIATRRVPARSHYDRDDERDMAFRGFLIFHDPPKKEAAPAIHALAQLGIRIKVISGDNRYVTAHLAEAIGLDPTSMLTGEELASLRDEALWHLAPRIDLFVEIDPQQKERIVRTLQRTGHTVGYLGDGINDAPALHAADVGISVEGAVDVARESADIVLLSRDLDVLREGIEDGRRTFANTLKYISITTSANFGNMISMALVMPLLPFLPLAPKQILLNNFLSDIPSIAISTDEVDKEDVARPQRWSIERIQRFMIVFGLVSSLFDALAFAVLLLVFETGEAAFQTSWFVISLLTELTVVLVLRTHRPAWRSRPGRLLFWSTLVLAVATFALPFMPPAASVFGFSPLSLPLVAAVAAIVLGYVVATEAVKVWLFRTKPSVLRPGVCAGP